MLTQTTAQAIAHAWIDSWNRHDLDAILSHYAEAIDFTSPFIVQLLGEPSGTLKDKAALRAYFAKGLAAYPDFKFELLHILTGVNSLVLYYRSVHNNLAAELMVLNTEGQIVQVMAHYCPDPERPVGT